MMTLSLGQRKEGKSLLLSSSINDEEHQMNTLNPPVALGGDHDQTRVLHRITPLQEWQRLVRLEWNCSFPAQTAAVME